MSEMDKHEDFSRYDCMTTEELQEILHQSAHNELGTEPDTQELYKIMEVLSVRRQDSDQPDFRSDEEAYADFCEYYMPKEKEEARPKEAKRPNRTLKTVAAVLAVVLILAVGTTVTVKAFRIDILSKIASWTKDIFQFSDSSQGEIPTEPEMENNLELKSLQDALAKENITEKLVPTWLPAGYAKYDLSVVSTPRVVRINAIYKNVDEKLIISIRQTIGTPANQVEKSDDLLEVHTAKGIDYYIFTNNENLQAKWSVGEFECIIGGNITLDEMKEIINSI